MHVLLVDPAAVTRSHFSQVARSLEMTPLEAENGLEALQAIRRHPVDMVLLRWALPVMSGRETLRRIRLEFDYRPVTVIVVFDGPDEAAEAEALRLGAQHHLCCPFTERQLVNRLVECAMLSI